MIQFQENSQTDGRMNGPYFMGLFWLPSGVQKFKLIFILIQLSEMHGVGRIKEM